MEEEKKYGSTTEEFSMIDLLVRELRGDSFHKLRISRIEEIPEREAEYATIKRPLPEAIHSWLLRQRVRLYCHQHQTLEAYREGKDIILTTPTSSGKTLSFNLPVMEALIQNPQATALYIYPAKALSNDQLKTLKSMEQEMGLSLRPALYDGDTPQSLRPGIRKNSRMVLTNPYELHMILPWHTKWSSFYSHLKAIVVDEAHCYRGVFGSHMAMVFRRLQRICRFYGSNPQWVLSSATLANPQEFSQKLLGKSCEWISDDTSPSKKKTFLLYNPFYDGVGLQSTYDTSRELMLELMKKHLQTICFTSSRKMAEWMGMSLKEEGERKYNIPSHRIASYRSGYMAEDRRSIEQGLKNGELLGVVSTNALELGIDVGSLDSVIICGYPGTQISTWQQAGRAGRGRKEALVALIAFQNPLDQYLMEHPEMFFKKNHEHAIVDLHNPYIASGHLLCASAELPLKEEEDKDAFDPQAWNILEEMEKLHLIRKTPAGWVYVGTGRATDAVRLNQIGSESYQLFAQGRVLETLERAQAYREAHPGAVFLHRNESYVVESMDHGKKFIQANPAEVDYYTEVLKEVQLEITDTQKSKQVHHIPVFFGDVHSQENFYAYQMKRFDKILGRIPLQLPEITFDTQALWFEIKPEIKQAVVQVLGEEAFVGGLHGLEHAMIGIMPFYVLCDRWDIGGFSTPSYLPSMNAHIFIYDGYEGGIGLSEKAYELFSDILLASYDVIRKCKCEKETGCPACIQSPKCGNANQMLHKSGALMILEKLLDPAKEKECAR